MSLCVGTARSMREEERTCGACACAYACGAVRVSSCAAHAPCARLRLRTNVATHAGQHATASSMNAAKSMPSNLLFPSLDHRTHASQY